MSTIRGKINVNLINKDRLYQGQKGKYLNFVLIPTPNSEYGDYMVKEDVSYKERQEGVGGAILGNATINVPKAGNVETDEYVDKDPDLPF